MANLKDGLDPNDGLDMMLLAVMQMVFQERPDDAAFMVGLAMGQVSQDRRDREGQEHQQPGEWRTHEVDGYRFSIRKTDSGQLEIQREEPNDAG